jgi:hypothetical protein
MAVEFRTRDESYTGPSVLRSRTTLQQASLFVDRLPPGLPTKHFNLRLIRDSYSHLPRYIIDAAIMIDIYSLILVATSANGMPSDDPEAVARIDKSSMGVDGLDIILVHDGHKYQGVLYPIPEVATELPQQR